ncbi:Gfo/Idh/MocA family protein [Haloarcula amylovorans]|uniref:Gfo/Idh/MocA family protein n=1 Tax=Haloarcula amylovorans TaxID=2562280 RepID=UPI0010763548|nr:Gfo/Idh/MocA family oxidoreductase [Halomicroarcula amylolytica]
MRYGVVGTGYWGKNHVRVAKELLDDGQLDEVVICDVDESRVESLADTYDLPYVTDVDDLDVDAATVATPSTTHPAIGDAMLNNGIDLLVEKPLALTSEEAWDLVTTAEDNDCTLGVGHIFRYHPALRALKRRIDRGELGRIKYLQTRRFSFRVPRTTTGVVYSLAVHDVDIYDYLLDSRPDTVHGQLDSFVREGITETATITLGYGDTTGVINSSWQIPVFDKTRDLVVVGSNRSAYIDYLENTKLELFDAEVFSDPTDGLKSRSDGSITHTAEEREPLKFEVESFIEASENGTQPPASGEVGARAVETLEHVERSAAENIVVDVEQPPMVQQP